MREYNKINSFTNCHSPENLFFSNFILFNNKLEIENKDLETNRENKIKPKGKK